MTDMQVHAHNQPAAALKPIVALNIAEAVARIAQLEGDVAALTAKLDICHRYAKMEGADGDFAQLANDYGGTQWEHDPAVEAVLAMQRHLVTLAPSLLAPAGDTTDHHDTVKG